MKTGGISFLGIPWIGEVISAAIEHEHGSEKTFAVSLVLDIINLIVVSIMNVDIFGYLYGPP